MNEKRLVTNLLWLAELVYTAFEKVAAQKHLDYLESVLTPNTLWVNLNKIDFSKKSRSANDSTIHRRNLCRVNISFFL